MTGVNEIKKTISTKDGENSNKTIKINGKLLSVQLKSAQKVHITIRSAENQNLILYNAHFDGDEYLPLKVSSRSSNGDVFNYNPDYYYLNEQLLIQVKGNPNTEVGYILRFANA